MPRSRHPSRRTQFFSNTLLMLMERNGINQVETAAATGIAVSRVNNYLKGKYRTVRPDHLGALAQAVGRTAEERGELARAYILDLLPDDLHRAVRVEVAGEHAAPAGRGRREKGPLPGTTAAALADLQSMSQRSAKARSRIQWFAEALREAHSK